MLVFTLKVMCIASDVPSMASDQRQYRTTNGIKTNNFNNNNNNNNSSSPIISRKVVVNDYDIFPSNNPTTNYTAIPSTNGKYLKSNTMPSASNKTLPATVNHYQNEETIASGYEMGNSHDENSNPVDKEALKRMNKFSIQKILRQGFTSWRTRKKQHQLPLTPPPLQHQPNFTPIGNTSSPPPTTLRSLSVDSIVASTPTAKTITPQHQRIIISEKVTPQAPNSVITTNESPKNRYIQSPWTTTNNSNNSPILVSTTEQQQRVLPVHFRDTNNNSSPTVTKKQPAPISPPPHPSSFKISESLTDMSPTVSITPTTIPTTNTLTATNIGPRIPPPVAPKPDSNRLTPIRTNYNTNSSTVASSSIPPTSLSKSNSNNTNLTTLSFNNTSSNVTESNILPSQQRFKVFPEKFITNRFTPIDQMIPSSISTTFNNKDEAQSALPPQPVYANLQISQPPSQQRTNSAVIIALQEKLNIRCSPVSTSPPPNNNNNV
ncbi:unnamed protein product, partial [Didymodactylos carnosus]